MPNKTINKNLFLVIYLAALLMFTGSCSHMPVSGGEPPPFDSERSQFGKPQIAGRIESDEITESSGIAASKCQPGVLWTHNDSGDGPFVFAIDQKGLNLGTWKVENAENFDWEDIASFKDDNGKCFLYIGDIGNSKKNPRTEHKIYRVVEPLISGSSQPTSRKEPALTEPAEVVVFSYPDGTHDAETLMVHPGTGDIYVITKERNAAAGVYKLKPAFGSTLIADKISDLTVPAIPNGFLTGGDIAPDGRRMIICDYFAAYEFTLPDDAKNFDDIWKTKPVVVNLGDRDQGEAICYSTDGKSLFATSEGKHSPLVEVARQKIEGV